MSSSQAMFCGCCEFPVIHNENSVCDIIEHLYKEGADNEVMAMCLVGTLGKKKAFDLARAILAELEPELEPIDV